jgi:Fic family protein
MKLNEEIWENSIKIRLMVNKMPDIALMPFFYKLLINELQSTNEIEGVHSTKKELSEKLSMLETKKTRIDKRFMGFIKTYQYIDEIKPFTKVEDFREMYDLVVADEVDKKDYPDGELFRKGTVNITDGVKQTHVGVYPESKIREDLNNLIQFLNTSYVPDLYKLMIAHYYYEYIHPFYDGNGRTGRLLVCSYVARKLEQFTAVTLSYSINQDKLKYYKALQELSIPNNKGEATFFCQTMLEILRNGQNYLIDDLSLGLNKTEKINQHMNMLDYDKKEKEILQALLQIDIFGSSDGGVTNTELGRNLQISRAKVDRTLEDFEKQGIVKKIKSRPVTYQVEEDYVDQVLNN